MKEGETVKVSVLWSAAPINGLRLLLARAVHSHYLTRENRVHPEEGVERVCSSHQIDVTAADAFGYQSRRGFTRPE
jgi:hypothetical protein